jgi:hypothetical protein
MNKRSPRFSLLAREQTEVFQLVCDCMRAGTLVAVSTFDLPGAQKCEQRAGAALGLQGRDGARFRKATFDQ